MADSITKRKQVSEVLLKDRTLHVSNKRARVESSARFDGSSGNGSVLACAFQAPSPQQQQAGASSSSALPTGPLARYLDNTAAQSLAPRIMPETPTTGTVFSAKSVKPRAGSSRSSLLSRHPERGAESNSPRSASPAASSTSTFSAATTSAAFSSRASLSSCRSSFTYGGDGRSSQRRIRGSVGSGVSSSRSYSRPAPSFLGRDDFFPSPSLRDAGDNGRWRRERRDRSSGRSGAKRELKHRERSSRRWLSSKGKDYASEAGVQEHTRSSSSRRCGYRGKKMSRSCSRERTCKNETMSSGCSGMECARCLEWHRRTREREPITRTLPMEYWVRTASCKAAKSKHIDFIDRVAYSREQFIEETVFTCPFTGSQRDIILERNMFPYDVPTDVEHWTLWSRNDLDNSQMETFVEKWASENHPHAVEWECDNNEGDRSIDWYHIHVFFRVGCEDRTGVERDPASVYDGPCRSPVAVSSISGTGSVDGGSTAEEETKITDSE